MSSFSLKTLHAHVNRPYRSSPGPLFQNEGRCSDFDMEIIFHSLRFYCKPLTIFGKLILSSVLRIFPIAVQGVVVYVVKQLLEDVSGYKVLKKIGEI